MSGHRGNHCRRWKHALPCPWYSYLLTKLSEVPMGEEGMDTDGSPVRSQSPLDATQEQVTSVPVRALHTRLRPPPSPPTMRARRPRTPPRSAGGSQEAYIVQQHFIHRQNNPWGICSLEVVLGDNRFFFSYLRYHLPYRLHWLNNQYTVVPRYYAVTSCDYCEY